MIKKENRRKLKRRVRVVQDRGKKSCRDQEMKGQSIGQKNRKLHKVLIN